MMAKHNQPQNSIIGMVMVFVCIWAVCLVVSANSMAISEKPSSYQADPEIVDNMAKLTPSSFYPRPNMANEYNENSVDNQAFFNKLFNMLERKKLPPNWIIHQALLSGQHKRQIRYQQCYFNPISCF